MNYALSELLKPQFTFCGGHVRFSPALEAPSRFGVFYARKIIVDALLSYIANRMPIYSIYIQSTPFSIYAFTRTQFQSIKEACSHSQIVFVADVKIYIKPTVRFNDNIKVIYI